MRQIWQKERGTFGIQMTRRGKKSVTRDKLDILPATFLDWPPFTVNMPDAILALILDANFHPLSTGSESRCNLSPGRRESNSTIVPPVERNYVNVPGTRLLPQSKNTLSSAFPSIFPKPFLPSPSRSCLESRDPPRAFLSSRENSKKFWDNLSHLFLLYNARM